jgi:hypothetical protein
VKLPIENFIAESRICMRNIQGKQVPSLRSG